jgi:DNA-damage-inducible protein D
MSLTGRKIAALRDTFEKFRFEFEGQEAWRARDLMRLLDYKNWQDFRNAVSRGWTACGQSGRDPAANFLTGDGTAPWHPDRIIRGVPNKSGRGAPAEDVILTRFGAYLIAMSADERIASVAFAKRYFATQTRKQEVLEQRLLDDDRLKAHGKFSKSEAELKEVVYEAGGNEHGFKAVRNRGHKAYFNRSPDQVAKQMGVPEERDYVDFMDPINVKALDLAQSITSRKARAETHDTVGRIATTNEKSHRNIRKGVVKSGFIPEQAKPVEDIRKVHERIGRQDAKRLKSK